MMATGSNGHEQMAAILQAERERAAPAAEAAEAARATEAEGEAEADAEADTGEAGDADAEDAGGARYRAVVMFRPTGWSHGGATRPGGSGPRAWADNGGATRIYAVPYSEHSSFPELQALVAALRPRAMLPTVNAESQKQREQLTALFAPGCDLTRDKRRLDWHFGSRSGAAAEGGGGGGDGGGDGGLKLDAAEVERQRELYRLLAAGDRTAHGGGSSSDAAPAKDRGGGSGGGGDAGGDKGEAAEGGAAEGDAAAVAAAAAAAVCEVAGPLPPRYVRCLLAGGGGDTETALAIHFGANGGLVPAPFASGEGSGEGSCAAAAAVAGGSPAASGGTPRAVGAARVVAAEAAGSECEMPPGCVAWVLGERWRLYTAREVLEARLEQLGALVLKKGSRLTSKQEVTHIVVPEGTEAGAVPRSHCPSALVVSEAWVARRARALQAGQLTAATPPAAKAKARGKKRAAEALAGGEKRAARERVPTAASAMRLHRAMSERLYLVERRDRSEASASGLAALRLEFAVLGSTGNVYTVTLCRLPSCTCVDHLERKSVCKHLLFVYHKVRTKAYLLPTPYYSLLYLLTTARCPPQGPARPARVGRAGAESAAAHRARGAAISSRRRRRGAERRQQRRRRRRRRWRRWRRRRRAIGERGCSRGIRTCRGEWHGGDGRGGGGGRGTGAARHAPRAAAATAGRRGVRGVLRRARARGGERRAGRG